MSRILVITPRTNDGRALRELLVADGHAVDLAGDLPQAIHQVETEAPDTIIADLEPWTWEARALTEQLHRALPRSPQVVFHVAMRGLGMGKHAV